LIAEINHGAHVELIASQSLADGEQMLDAERGARHGANRALLTALDASGEHNLAFAGEQRHRRHLAHIQAHGIVRLVDFDCG